MTDYFSLFNEVPRPWLDQQSLQDSFHRMAGQLHPDKQGDADPATRSKAAREFADLNQAYQCLMDPKARLLHLLELTRGKKPDDMGQIPEALADRFIGVAHTCREGDELLAEKSRTESPLLRVGLFQRSQAWLEKAVRLQAEFLEWEKRVLADLKGLDEEWRLQPAMAATALLPRLEEHYRMLAYLNRWNHQLRNRIGRMTF